MKKSIIGKVSIICTVLCLSFSCERESEIVFSQTGVPVDLGLSVKWASCNVGANSPEDYGDYFAWGETTLKDKYSIDNYTFKANPTKLSLSDDAAHVNWGGDWRMPTEAEQDELRNTFYTTWTWTTQNGVDGYTVTSNTNGKSIFLPAAGYRYETFSEEVGAIGYYWSRTRDNTNFQHVSHYIYFAESYVDKDSDSRYYAHPIRPVLP